MKTKLRWMAGWVACAAVLVWFVGLNAAESRPAGAFEYATIRWDGKDNTHIVRPGGRVEFIGGELRRAEKPDRTDDRAFYMNVAMNGLSKEGYEFAGMTPDSIVMRREAPR